MTTNNFDRQYHELLSKILEIGVRKSDRTGTGTLSIFGHMMKFDLREGFPLITTKKIHLKSIIHELLWMLSGSTNIKYLNDNGVSIWDEWADENGNLGPIYSHQWRRWGSRPDAISQPNPKLRHGVDATYLGVANGFGKEGSPLKKTWEGMIARCYDKNSISYPLYGARGVHVCDRWLEFIAFEEDAKSLPGWENKKDNPRGFVLDKDALDGFLYSPETAIWLSCAANNRLRSKRLYTVEKDGEKFEFRNPTEFCREHGIDDRNFSDLWTGKKDAKVRYGFSLVEVKDLDPGIDQISKIVDSLKSGPWGRRIMLSGWNVADIPRMNLPPCHFNAQFNVEPKNPVIGYERHVAEGHVDPEPEVLNCMMNIRSWDVFLGGPFNIAQYALLTMMLAQVSGLEPGVLTICSGDTHLYLNHLEQAKLQLGREPYAPPKMKLDSGVTDIDDFKYEHFTMEDYEHHPHIKGEVSV